MPNFCEIRTGIREPDVCRVNKYARGDEAPRALIARAVEGGWRLERKAHNDSSRMCEEIGPASGSEASSLLLEHAGQRTPPVASQTFAHRGHCRHPG